MTDAQKKIDRTAFFAFKEAWLFEQASNLLTDKRAEGSVASAPIVVNCAFAIEVYFKCLYMIANGTVPPQIHNLQCLYDKLTKDEQDAVAKLYAQLVAKEPQSADLPFAMVLDWAKNAFEKWRYNYERWQQDKIESRAFGNGEILCQAVRERIIELKPDWKNSLRNDFA